MTGYTVHSGTTIQFSEGWDRIFESPAKTRKPTATAKGQKQNASGKVPTKKIPTAKPTSRKKVSAKRK